MRKSPEQWLEEASPGAKTKGTLKLFLGYAPGVGKTYSMLSEAIRRHSRGEDVVIGFLESHGRKAVTELAAELETVPRRKLEYKGTLFEEMDLEGVLKRRPQVAVVDELAHTDIPGSKNRKRYEDVQELLAAQIDVLSTLNIQHLDSIAPVVHSITGVVVRETIPDWVLQTASEIVMIDLTPEALQNRLRRGDVYNPDKVDQALNNFFRRGNLIALRELALRQVAEQVDQTLESYRADQAIKENWPVRERLAVCVSSNPSAQYLIARAARMARQLEAEFYTVCVETAADQTPDNQKSLAANLRLAEELGARVALLQGKNVAEAVATFVREKHITQVIFGHSARSGWRRYFSAIPQFLRRAPAVDVHIVKQGSEGQ